MNPAVTPSGAARQEAGPAGAPAEALKLAEHLVGRQLEPQVRVVGRRSRRAVARLKAGDAHRLVRRASGEDAPARRAEAGRPLPHVIDGQGRRRVRVLRLDGPVVRAHRGAEVSEVAR